MHLPLRYPDGYAYTITNTTEYGWYELDAAITLSFLSTYFFSRSASQTFTTKGSIKGGGVWATGEIYENTMTIPTAERIWSPCGSVGNDSVLNINTRKTLTSTDPNVYSGGLISEVPMLTHLGLQWKRC